MKRIWIAATIAALALGAAPAAAELCTIDAVPAATLLLPYFEVDLGKNNFRKVEQTIISLQNAGAAPALAHVTLWTDLSVPTLSFDVFLTGFDVEEINLAELFYTGGIRGLQGADFTRGFVLGQTPSGGLQSRGLLIQAHRGEPVGGPGGDCYGVPTGDNVARGYVTIDNVSEPSTLFPSDSGYFGSNGVANDINQLWGVVLVKLNKALQADLLVSVEAGDFGSNDYTFYGRYVGFDGSDGREPLGRKWAARYFSGAERTDLVVWRDSTAVQEPFDCDELGQAGWYPLEQTQAIAFNEFEEGLELFVDVPQDQPLPGLPSDQPMDPGFPAETQRIRVVSPQIGTGPFRSGWIYLDLEDPDLPTQSLVWVRQGFRKRAALYPGLPWYDVSNGGSPADGTACGRAPRRTLLPIP